MLGDPQPSSQAVRLESLGPDCLETDAEDGTTVPIRAARGMSFGRDELDE
jgi:hypothetical protein